MTTIDEIMAAAYAEVAATAAGRSVCPRLAAAELRTLITQAIAEARAYGAMEEVQRIFPCCGWNNESPAEHCMDCPDKREPVRLTDEQIGAEMVRPGNETISEFARAIETAVLAANGLTK